MNRLKLVVLYRQSHQGVNLGGVVHEVGPVIQFLDEQLLALWRRINNLAGHSIFQARAGLCPDIQIYSLDGAADLNGHVGCKHAAPNHFATLKKGSSIAQGLFGRGVSFVLCNIGILEQLVRGGNDVLDFGAGSRL